MRKKVSHGTLAINSFKKAIIVILIVIILAVVILKVDINIDSLEIIPKKNVPNNPLTVDNPYHTRFGEIYRIHNPNKMKVFTEVQIKCYDYGGNLVQIADSTNFYILPESYINYNLGFDREIQKNCPPSSTYKVSAVILN